MLEKYIIKLLYDHDCVVIPDFGSFVLRYRSATLDEKYSVFKPPVKELAFNAELKSDDGMLYAFVAQEKKISYDWAKKYVSAIIEDINKRLIMREIVVMSGLGYFFLDENDNMTFIVQPNANFLEDTLWYSNFSLKRVEKQQNNNPDYLVLKPSKHENGFKIAMKRAASIVFVLCMGAAAYVGADVCLQNVYNAGFTFFDGKNTPSVEQNAAIMPDNAVSVQVNDIKTNAEDAIQTTDNDVNADESTSSDVSEQPEPEVGQTTTNDEAGNATTSVSTYDEIISDKDVVSQRNVPELAYIIVASYPASYFSDAKTHVEQLRTNGYDKAVIVFFDGRCRVAAFYGADEASTMSALDTIKHDLNKDAWLLFY